MRINAKKEGKKRSTLLELEKIPKGYKNLENDLILSKIDQKKIVENVVTPELIRNSSKDDGTQGTS